LPLKGLTGGLEKIPNIINGCGGQNKQGGLEFEKWLYMIIKLWKEQKQVVRKHKTKIHTETCYFSRHIGHK